MWRSRFGLTRGRSCSVLSSHGWFRNVARLCAAIAVQRRAPAARQVGHEHLGRDRVPHQVQQLVARVEVVVERHRAGSQLARDAPDRHLREAPPRRRSAAPCGRSRPATARGCAVRDAPRSAASARLTFRTAYPYRTPYDDVRCTNEDLGRRFGATEALTGLDLCVRARHRARTAGPQRRGQDDRRADPHHAARPHHRPRVRGRPRRRHRPAGRARVDLARRAAGVARRPPDRSREPDAARTPAAALQARGDRPGRASCCTTSGSNTPPTARSRPTAAACAGAWTWRPAWSCDGR